MTRARSDHVMSPRTFGGASGRSAFATLAALMNLTILAGCNRPISDPTELKAIATEAFSLMDKYPAASSGADVGIGRSHWPAAIANLRPENVLVSEWGVDILVERDFDGGWGHHVVRSSLALPMPRECYLEVSEGIFRHDPC